MKAYTKTFLKFNEIFTGKYEHLGHLFKNDDNLPFSFGDNDYTLIAWYRFKNCFQGIIDEHDFGHEILGRGPFRLNGKRSWSRSKSSLQSTMSNC